MGGPPAERAACGRLLPPWTPHAVRLCQSIHVFQALLFHFLVIPDDSQESLRGFFSPSKSPSASSGKNKNNPKQKSLPHQGPSQVAPIKVSNEQKDAAGRKSPKTRAPGATPGAAPGTNPSYCGTRSVHLHKFSFHTLHLEYI
jgi:hypothetical protein